VPVKSHQQEALKPTLLEAEKAWIGVVVMIMSVYDSTKQIASIFHKGEMKARHGADWLIAAQTNVYGWIALGWLGMGRTRMDRLDTHNLK
jgi:hypothetical protein